MISKEILLELLRDACRAPSGDNVQPWRFTWNGESLSLYNIPGIHNLHFDFKERGAYVAHGAFIENLCIAAPHYGYEVVLKLFPDASEPNLVATIKFNSCIPHDDVLYKSIHKRATNRRPYIANKVTAQEKEHLEQVKVRPETTIRFLYDQNSITHLAQNISLLERVLLGNREMTDMFFSHVVWNKKDEHKQKSGLFIKTLEFNPVQEFIFFLASKSWIMRFFRYLGLPKFIAHEDAKLYASSSILGSISPHDFSPNSFIAAGRTLERIWLVATSLGLAFQPLFGTTMLGYKTTHSIPTPLLKEEQDLLSIAVKELEHSFKNINDTPSILFRVGRAARPSAYTSRKEPDIVYN